MPTTPAGIRYPASSDSINIPQDFLNLATDVDTYVQAQVGANVTPSSTTTLTNKTLNLTSNTLTGTKAQFNTAMSDADFATLTGTETLTNKTIDSPTFTGQVTGLELGAVQSLIFEGTTADAFETTLTAGEPTADRTITLPDTTGTLALQADVTTASNLVTALEIAVIMAAF
jgi:hypothetical protein